jgi:anti-anti-sigma factor
MPIAETTEFVHRVARQDNSPSTEPHTQHAARFATEWLAQSTAVITADGDLDASNAGPLAAYALGRLPRCRSMILDLTGLNFCGVEGFSILHTLQGRCAGVAVRWVLVPSPAVSRVLRLGDPEAALPTADSVGAAVAAIQGDGERPLLKLVPETR